MVNIPSIPIEKYIIRNTISLYVVPGSSQITLTEHDNSLKLYIHAQPEDNKANQAVIQYFKKTYKLNVRIKLGQKCRDKVLEII